MNLINCFISFLVTSLNPLENTHLIPVSLAESIYSFLNSFSIQNIKSLTSTNKHFHSVLSRRFRHCITKASGKAHTPKEERARAPAIAGERVLCAQLSPLRRLRRHLSRRERHFANLIITQIGRENKSDIPTSQGNSICFLTDKLGFSWEMQDLSTHRKRRIC